MQLYDYYRAGSEGRRLPSGSKEQAEKLSEERLRPSLDNPDYLVYCKRRDFLTSSLQMLSCQQPQVLDVGGRIQPYRGLFEVKGASYLAIDRILGGLVDVIAEAEHIPFADEIFDFVLCTQVLSYVTEPAVAVAEMYRVLKNGGFLFLSAPAFFPTHHDERWRFTQSGLQTLLSRFSDVQIMPEGHSFAGLCRTVNVSLNISLHNPLVRRVLRRIIIPLVNFLGSKLDRFSANNDQLITNISCFAQKKDSSIETNLVENDFDESFSKS